MNLLALLGLPKPDARAAAILRNELHAGGLEGGLNSIQGAGIKRLTPLQAGDCIGRHLGRRGKIPDTPAESSSSHAALDRQHRNPVTKFLREDERATIVTKFGCWNNIRMAGRGRWKLPAPGLTTTRSHEEQAMATRALTAPPFRTSRRRRLAVPAELPQPFTPIRSLAERQRVELLIEQLIQLLDHHDAATPAEAGLRELPSEPSCFPCGAVLAASVSTGGRGA